MSSYTTECTRDEDTAASSVDQGMSCENKSAVHESTEEDDATTRNNSNHPKQKGQQNRRLRPKISVLPPAVVDLIAAGEVVQRPVSVIKELLENSLDAGATQVVVQFDGLSKMSITDNGKGVPKADLDLLCTRHATSKLASVDDFSSLQTFGFRGEALASTSMVSRLLTVISRVRVGDYDDDDDHGISSNSAAVAYSQSYKLGKPIQKVPRPCARKMGTTITIEDLFYNVPHRQKAYSRKDSEEYGKIHKIVQDYSIHYPTVGFVCQRRTATGKSKQLMVDCNTGQIPAVKALLQSRQMAMAAKNDNNKTEMIREATKQILSHVLESNLANHLLYMECKSENNNNDTIGTSSAKNDDAISKGVDSTQACSNNDKKPTTSTLYDFRYAAEIYFTSPSYHSTGGKGGKAKQGKFVLFLNHRLVDLPPLKRSLEDVYAQLGNPNKNKGSSSKANNNLGKPVLVVNLMVPGCQVDVNVHPSKRQVALMHQEDLVRDISSKLKERLEEDGQAFVAQSVKTVVRKNPYAKAKPNNNSNNNNTVTVTKRKRQGDCSGGGNAGNCCGGGDESESDDSGESPSKQQKRCAPAQKTPDDTKGRKQPNNPSSSNSNHSSNKKVAPSKLIRTNSAARAGAIEPFLVSTQTQQSQSQLVLSQSTQNSEETTDASAEQPPSSLSSNPQQELQQQFSVLHVSTCPLSNPLPPLDLSQPGAFAEQLKRERCTCPTEPARRTVLVPNTVVRPKRVVPTPSKYTSIATLRKRIGKQQCFETTAMIRKAFFMGVMSHQRSLIQCDEELVMVNHFELAKELFYQLALARFGDGAQLAQLGGSEVGGGNGGIHIQTLVAQALQCEDELALQHEKDRENEKLGDRNSNSNNDPSDAMSLSGMLQVNDSNRTLAQHVTARLVESAAMLDDYFSIRIESQNETKNENGGHKLSIDDISSGAILTGLPVLLEGHCPQPHALPIFLLRLATQVDWTREKHCFHGVCKELGNYYAMLPNESSSSSSSSSSSPSGGELNSYVQHHLFPALSYLMLPSKNLAKNGHFTKMTKLSTLYKVFERC